MRKLLLLTCLSASCMITIQATDMGAGAKAALPKLSKEEATKSLFDLITAARPRSQKIIDIAQAENLIPQANINTQFGDEKESFLHLALDQGIKVPELYKVFLAQPTYDPSMKNAKGQTALTLVNTRMGQLKNLEHYQVWLHHKKSGGKLTNEAQETQELVQLVESALPQYEVLRTLLEEATKPQEAKDREIAQLKARLAELEGKKS